MPVVFRYRGFKFFFYSNEGSPREPIHVHVEKGEAEAKFWLFPEVSLAYNDGYDTRRSANDWDREGESGTHREGMG